MTKDKILVVEDESIIALDIKNMLIHLGYTVPAVLNCGRDAIQMSKEIRPDLVLMDINIKGDMDGVEAAKRIFLQFNIPVIYITAYSDKKTLKRAVKSNPYGYIPKPFDSLELHTLIALTINSHRMKKYFQSDDILEKSNTSLVM